MNKGIHTKVVPIVNAVVVIATGFNVLEQERQFGYVFFVCAALYFLIVVLTLRGYIHKERISDIAAALTLIMIATDFYLQGKNALPIAYLIAAILNLFLPAWGRKRRAQKELEKTKDQMK